MVVEDEKVLACILHDVLAEVLDEKAYGGRAAILVGGGQLKRMVALVGKEHLKPTAAGK